MAQGPTTGESRQTDSWNLLQWILLVVWAVAVIGGVIAFVVTDTGVKTGSREVFSGFLILVGTLLALARFPNKQRPVLPDQDLEIWAIAYLGLGALAPLVAAFDEAPNHWAWVFVIAAAAGLIGIGIWEYRGRRG